MGGTPWKKYENTGPAPEGAPWARYGGNKTSWMSAARMAADHFTPEEIAAAEAEEARLKARQRELLSRGSVYGPQNKNRAESRDIYLKQQNKTMTAPEAAMVRASNSAALGLPSLANKTLRDQVGTAGREHPNTSLAADAAGFMVPGAPIFKLGEKAAGLAGRGLAQAGFRAPAGTGIGSKLTRYAPLPMKGAAAGVADYAVYDATVGAGTRAAEQGRDATMKERLMSGASAPLKPEAYLGAAFSPIYRAGRGAVTAAQNTIDASIEAGKLQLRGGSFTPSGRAEWARQLEASNTPEGKAYRMIAKRLEKDGVTADMLDQALQNYKYGSYSTVEEMLFELGEAATNGKGGGHLKQLAVALGSVGGDAQQLARENFRTRRLESATRIRDDLRKATGLKGQDFYQVGDELDAARRELPGPLYEEAHAKSISDDAWTETVLPLLETSPSARKALSEAGTYASDTGELAVAAEINKFVDALDSGGLRGDLQPGAAGNVPPKLSTKALDFVDRMLGDRAASLRSATNRRDELARGPAEAQARLRSVLDEQTGLNEGRDLSYKFRTAKDALEFGRNAVKNGTDLDTLRSEFAKQAGKFDDSTINSALLMGWMRGAEDTINKASNPATAIRQLYGSPRQREKMVEMLQGLDEDGLNLSSGMQSDATKRLRQVVGGKYRADPQSPQGMGRIDRERLMLDSEGEIVAGSQTGQRNEAVEAQGGLQRAVNEMIGLLGEPNEAKKKLLRFANNRMNQPGIYKPEVNKALGEAMFTGGEKNLQAVISKLRSGEVKQLPKKGRKSKLPDGLPKKKSGVGNKVADAAALTAISANLAGQAGADNVNYTTQLDSVNSKISELESVQIPELEAELDQITNPDIDPKQLQRLLQARGLELGKHGIDGIIGDDTIAARKENVLKIEAEIAARRDDLAQLKKQKTDIRRGMINSETAEDPMMGWARKGLEGSGLIGGFWLGKRLRGGAVKKSQEAANKIEQKANSLVNLNPISRRNTGADSLNTRAGNINDYWRLGGAVEAYPFKTKARSGDWTTRPKPADPSELFPAPKAFNAKDATVTGIAATDAATFEVLRQNAEKKLSAIEAEINQYEDDPNGLEELRRLREEKRQLEAFITGYMFLSRVGAGVAGGRLLGAHSQPYARPLPKIGDAESEMALIRKRIAKKN